MAICTTATCSPPIANRGLPSHLELINGDPSYEIAPMLWHRWHELADNVRFGVQRRFYALVDAAGFDEDRARAYVIVRVVREATQDPTNLTTYVALAKAAQD